VGIAALSESVSVPVTGFVSTGVNVNWIVQVVPGAIDPHVCAAVTVEDEGVIEFNCSEAFPQFCTLRFWLIGVPTG